MISMHINGRYTLVEKAQVQMPNSESVMADPL